MKSAPTDAGEIVTHLNDAEIGMAWWNRLTPLRRAEWLDRAGSAVPADAWQAFKRQAARNDEQEVNRS